MTNDAYNTPTFRALAAGIRANVPVILWGQPGQAKTALIEALGTRNGYHVETVVGSVREASDFLGLPIESGAEVSYAPPAWAKRLAAAKAGLLFLDELSICPPSVMRAMLRILQEREVGELPLPDSVAVVAAANPPTPSNGADYLPAPVANRLMHIDWHAPVDSWLQGIVRGFDAIDAPSLDDLLGSPRAGAREKVGAAVATFLRSRRNLLDAGEPPDPVTAGRGWPSLRSWANAVSVLSQLDPGDEDATLVVLKGCVGDGAATEYVAWLAVNELYDPAEVLERPSMVDWKSRPDRIYALLEAVTAIALAGDARTWAKAAAVMVACAKAGKPDLAMPSVGRLVNAKPANVEIPQALRDAFEDLMYRTGLHARAAA
jgi:MoxR-like ATPase